MPQLNRQVYLSIFKRFVKNKCLYYFKYQKFSISHLRKNIFNFNNFLYNCNSDSSLAYKYIGM